MVIIPCHNLNCSLSQCCCTSDLTPIQFVVSLGYCWVPCSWQQNDRAAVCLSSVDLGVDKCWEMGRENPSDFVLKMLADLASFSLFQVFFPYCKQNDTVWEYLLWERGFLLNHRVGHKTSILVAQHTGPMLHIGQATAEGCCLEIHNCIVAV